MAVLLLALRRIFSLLLGSTMLAHLGPGGFLACRASSAGSVWGRLHARFRRGRCG